MKINLFNLFKKKDPKKEPKTGELWKTSASNAVEIMENNERYIKHKSQDGTITYKNKKCFMEHYDKL